MDFDEIMTQIAANEKRRLEDLRAKAYMDHRLSEMMAFAFNDPAKMPKVEEAYPFVKDENEQAEQQSVSEPEWKKDQLLLMQQAQRIKQFNKNKGGGS
ncbi:hypothetical protein FOD75_07460 [Limosilactobacillus reuteri]|uniref:Uncharacterized protein n=1 Tax=Limosilactobacillus reuteri TaxID=1598 RepID=A0A517D6E6_LIMRT|nr:hypothetical protein [Limosilactobacillus reuteri]QDR72910.1 hypothetical protein FOD75_07460 [Limosilactobacillus reuteri]